MKRCALCLIRFKPDPEYSSLCPACFEEMGSGQAGSENTIAMCSALSKLVNLDLDLQDAKLLADSGGGQYVLRHIILREMDIGMKEKVLQEELHNLGFPLDLKELRKQLERKRVKQ